MITPQTIVNAYDYDSFYELLENLEKEGKTTGPNQSESMVHYSKMNMARMRRLTKTIKLLPETIEALEKLEKPLTWLVITEAWCGDAAQNIPPIQKMAEASDKIQLRFILRDENLEIMDQHLTNGGRSIPKLVCLDTNTLKVLGDWGPRPEPLMQMYAEHKKKPEESHEVFTEQLQRWYNQDKSETMQHELVALLKKWAQQ